MSMQKIYFMYSNFMKTFKIRLFDAAKIESVQYSRLKSAMSTVLIKNNYHGFAEEVARIFTGASKVNSGPKYQNFKTVVTKAYQPSGIPLTANFLFRCHLHTSASVCNFSNIQRQAKEKKQILYYSLAIGAVFLGTLLALRPLDQNYDIINVPETSNKKV